MLENTGTHFANIKVWIESIIKAVQFVAYILILVNAC